MEESSGVIEFGPGSGSLIDSAETEVFRPQQSVETVDRQKQGDEKLDRVLDDFARRMNRLGETLDHGFEMMHREMRHFASTVDERIERMHEMSMQRINTVENMQRDFTEGRGQTSSTPRDRNVNFNIDTEICDKANVKMKPQNFNGEEDLDDYLNHFNLVADLNGWDYKVKSLYLASCLTGDARGLLNELTTVERKDYDKIVDVLNLRFGSLNRAEVYRSELQTRTKRRDESLSEMAQSIKKLTRKAYPSANASVIETLAMDYFIDAIPFKDVRIRLREVSPKTLSEAEEIAVRLESVHVSDRNRNSYERNKVYNVKSIDVKKNEQDKILETLQKLDTKLNSVTEEVKELKIKKPNIFRQDQIQTQSFNRQPYRNFGNDNGFRQNYQRDNFRQNQDRNSKRNSLENGKLSTSGGEVRQRYTAPRN